MREAEKRLERREAEALELVVAYTAARDAKADTRVVLSDLYEAGRDVKKARAELDDARAASLEPATATPEEPAS